MSVDSLPHAAESPRIGRYEVLGRLAMGGMAEVYLACIRGPSAFEHAVVVKRILPHLADLADFTTMFLDEARIAASIRHPNVVRVHELARDDDGLYLVMEYLHGESLSSLQRRLAARHVSLPPSLAAWIIAEACGGLHAAHELRDASGRPKSLVHRDVSPDNLFVTYDGSVKVVDFGIAKAADRITKTDTGQIKGKFQYMSPEQCSAMPLDRRSDLFSAGIVLFELITGHRLFYRSTRMATWVAVTQEPIPRASSVVQELPESVDRIVARALEREFEARYPTALEMRKELLSFVRTVPGYELPEERLRALMHELFADRIAQKNELLQRMEEGRAIGPMPPPQADEHVEMPTVAAILGPSNTTMVDPPPSRTPARMAIGVTLALALALGSFATIGLAMNWPREQAVLPSPIEAQASEEEITLTIETDPPGAEISIDAVGRGTSPLVLPFPRGNDPVTITARASGFNEARSIIVPEVSVLVRLPLVLAASSAAQETPRVHPPARRLRRSTARPVEEQATPPPFERFE